MDVDLQDPPQLIEEMYHAVKEEGYDCAAARRITREGEPPIRSFFAKCFYKLINKISKAEIVDGARDYRLMKRQMVDAILKMSENNRFTKGIFSWVGFEVKWLEYVNTQRVAGETKWSFWKLFLYSLDGIVQVAPSLRGSAPPGTFKGILAKQGSQIGEGALILHPVAAEELCPGCTENSLGDANQPGSPF
jgi:glycosyltransferase involved in cell wall biosynthesis